MLCLNSLYPLPQVHEYYGDSPDVLYLAISLIDRYLAKEEDRIIRDNLQLLVVGAVCFRLSCKYEDLFVLDLDEMSQLVEGGLICAFWRAEQFQ